jgi:integrase
LHSRRLRYRGIQGFTDAVKRAGIKDFRFHDLRHCAITNMRRAGLDPFTIMKATGHKTLKMVERYNTVEREDGEEA